MLKSVPAAIAVMVAMHWAAIAASVLYGPEWDRNPESIVAIGLVFSQAGLLGVLLGLGTQSLPARLLETLIGLALPCNIAFIGDYRVAGIWCSLLVTTTGLTAGLLGLLRRRGLALQIFNPPQQAQCVEGLQFSLRHLFFWFLAVAAVVRLGQLLNPGGLLGILLAFGLGFGGSAVLALWATLGKKQVLLRGVLVVLLAAVGGGAGSIYYLGGYDGYECFSYGGLTAFQSAFMVLSLALLRPSGLRLVRIRPTEPNAEKSA